MSLITRTLQLSTRTLGSVFSKVCPTNKGALAWRYQSAILPSSCGISTTSIRRDLMEFFDDKKNWNKQEVRHGRAWTKDELRLKSASDLHKIWFVLLKERNMLMTMEHECKEKHRLFPSAERIDKVKISMDNIETVVKERNRAYYELETGEAGVREEEEIFTPLGIKAKYVTKEYTIPKEENRKWHENRRYRGYAVMKFRRLYKEQELLEKRRERTRNRNHVKGLLRRFPEMDLNILKEKYPDVDIDKLLAKDVIRPHYFKEE